MAPRFLYEISPWGLSVEERKQWFEGLEQFGPDTIRVRLAQTRGTSDDSYLILTKQLTPLRGFAEDWLKWKDEQRAASIAAREERMVSASEAAARAARWAAIAATVAAVGSFIAAGAALVN